METNEFSLLKGTLILEQPINGYRVAIDPIFLAASVPIKQFENKKILDMGCGIGTIGFCILERFSVDITGIDIQPELIEIAKRNAKNNNKTGINFICENIKEYQSEQLYDAITMNPPYIKHGTSSNNQCKQMANAETNNVSFIDWSNSASRNLKKGGYIFLIHRADRMDEILQDMQKSDFGSFIIFPLWPGEKSEAKRIIIIARKQKFSPLKLLSGLVLHEKHIYTDKASEILNSPIELKII